MDGQRTNRRPTSEAAPPPDARRASDGVDAAQRAASGEAAAGAKQHSRPTTASPRGDRSGGGTTRVLPKRSIRPASPSPVGRKLPREGYHGGGAFIVPNPALLESVVDQVGLYADHDPGLPGLGSTAGRPLERAPSRSASRGDGARRNLASREAPREGRHPSVTSVAGDGGRGRSGTSQPDTPASSAPLGGDGEGKGAKKVGQEERKRQEIYAKWMKIEAIRTQDQKGILERVERGHDRREERYERLVEAVTGRDNLAYKTALALRERENHEEKRKQELHEAWEAKVYQPMTWQAKAHMNPPDRSRLQQEQGKKSVGFRLEQDRRYIKINVLDDPLRGTVVDHARENLFHHVATHVMGSSHSSPALGDVHNGSFVPRARTRPVLEPSNWSLPKIRATAYGDFANTCEYGPGFRRALRGGTDVHVHSTDDGVLAAGSLHSRAHGHGDVGILRGDVAARGESSIFKATHGASCAAPAQDHFMFEKGPGITDLEFPLGKRIFPEFH